MRKIFFFIVFFCLLNSCSKECKRVWRNYFAKYRVIKDYDTFSFEPYNFYPQNTLENIKMNDKMLMEVYLYGYVDSIRYADSFNKLRNMGYRVELNWYKYIYFRNSEENVLFGEICLLMPKNNDSCGCEIVYNNNCRP
ncbi:MAG: hypothetical protein MUE53_09565 [Chitinophagales bacterium]|nr:hypothetical protein [Chitinophagales bacterium]